MLFSKFKQRYAKLLQETHKTNENWGNESYDKEFADLAWKEYKDVIRSNLTKKSENKSTGLNPFTWETDLFY